MDAAQPALLRALVGAACVLLGCAMFFGGGSGHDSVWWLGLGVVGVLSVALVFGLSGRFPLPLLARPELALVACAGGLVVWQGLSVLWSVAPDRSWDAFDKGLVLLGFLGLGLLVGGIAGCSRVGVLIAALLGAVLVWALLGRAIPALFEDGERVARLRNPVGYWNGLALLADFALPLGLWLGVRAGARASVRVGGVLLVYAAVLVILLTVSRTGVAAAAAAVALWLVLAERRVEGALVALTGTVPATAVASFAFARPALVDDGQAYSDRVRDGAAFGVLALLGRGSRRRRGGVGPAPRAAAARRRAPWPRRGRLRRWRARPRRARARGRQSGRVGVGSVLRERVDDERSRPFAGGGLEQPLRVVGRSPGRLAGRPTRRRRREHVRDRAAAPARERGVGQRAA